MTTWSNGIDLTKAEEKELKRLNGKHRDIATLGIGAEKRMAEKVERQLQMEAFVIRHGISCFKCSSTFQDWAKTGMSNFGRPWAICVRCVREKKGAA